MAARFEVFTGDDNTRVRQLYPVADFRLGDVHPGLAGTGVGAGLAREQAVAAAGVLAGRTVDQVMAAVREAAGGALAPVAERRGRRWLEQMIPAAPLITELDRYLSGELVVEQGRLGELAAGLAGTPAREMVLDLLLAAPDGLLAELASLAGQGGLSGPSGLAGGGRLRVALEAVFLDGHRKLARLGLRFADEDQAVVRPEFPVAGFEAWMLDEALAGVDLAGPLTGAQAAVIAKAIRGFPDERVALLAQWHAGRLAPVVSARVTHVAGQLRPVAERAWTVWRRVRGEVDADLPAARLAGLAVDLLGTQAREVVLDLLVAVPDDEFTAVVAAWGGVGRLARDLAAAFPGGHSELARLWEDRFAADRVTIRPAYPAGRFQPGKLHPDLAGVALGGEPDPGKSGVIAAVLASDAGARVEGMSPAEAARAVRWAEGARSGWADRVMRYLTGDDRYELTPAEQADLAGWLLAGQPPPRAAHAAGLLLREGTPDLSRLTADGPRFLALLAAAIPGAGAADEFLAARFEGVGAAAVRAALGAGRARLAGQQPPPFHTGLLFPGHPGLATLDLGGPLDTRQLRAMMTALSAGALNELGLRGLGRAQYALLQLRDQLNRHPAAFNDAIFGLESVLAQVDRRIARWIDQPSLGYWSVPLPPGGKEEVDRVLGLPAEAEPPLDETALGRDLRALYQSELRELLPPDTAGKGERAHADPWQLYPWAHILQVSAQADQAIRNTFPSAQGPHLTSDTVRDAFVEVNDAMKTADPADLHKLARSMLHMWSFSGYDVGQRVRRDQAAPAFDEEGNPRNPSARAIDQAVTAMIGELGSATPRRPEICSGC